ncbi:AbrB/MazE/SpoVT family DNA-binding domain-containing protein [Pseudomonas sp. LS-2]|uniref:AbrB/MazE/SpoVT family DNA-binding domain-containing protein n=1 Tax=Pseudomonas sp. LS-2 TaxID=2315859 RepID=UPI000E74C60A|nr:AbrB/MazE/SpoVT family DNA-binding domain-containing protein [Pseudomonas sp. LS-2]RJX77834.1 AbrB/MazE/SpoVT family DNA-binding domain-containing protein [Pseudomonas sp. LS-2]
MNSSFKVVIEDWDGDGAIRIPDEALQEMGLDAGDSLYLLEEFIGNTRCVVLSKTPKLPDRIDELVEAWDGNLSKSG